MTVQPDPANTAWWLRAEFHPFSTSVRGVPVEQIAARWCFANEFLPELIPEQYLSELDPSLSFTVPTRFDAQGPQAAMVGAFETCTHEKGLFLLILEQRTTGTAIRLLAEFSGHNAIAALKQGEHGSLELWWCSSCDNFMVLTWNAANRQFVWQAGLDGAGLDDAGVDATQN